MNVVLGTLVDNNRPGLTRDECVTACRNEPACIAAQHSRLFSRPTSCQLFSAVTRYDPASSTNFFVFQKLCDAGGDAPAGR